jgi:cell division protein FtsQ
MAKRLGANSRRVVAERKVNTKREAGVIARRVIPVVKYLAIAAAIGAGGFMAARSLMHSSHLLAGFKVKQVSVKGVHRLDKATVLKIAGIKTGDQLLKLKTKEIRKRVAGLCWVLTVNVHRRLPDAVVIEIEEREPVALVDTGRICLTDRQGVLLPLRPNAYVDLPLLSGVCLQRPAVVPARLSAETVAAMDELFTQLAGCPTSLVHRISQIHFANGATVQCKLAGNPALIELDRGNIAHGIGRLEQILASLDKEDRGQPRRINLCYESLAYVVGATESENSAGLGGSVKPHPQIKVN